MVAHAPATRQSAEQRALARATAEGTEALFHVDAWFASSTSTPGRWYRIVNDTCECEAAQRGLACKHIAAVHHIEQQPCRHCGASGDSVRRYVRVHSERTMAVVECRDSRACQRRRGWRA